MTLGYLESLYRIECTVYNPIIGSAETQSKNEYTKTFCEQAEYQINKKVHDETVDRNYQAGKKAAVESHKGHQNLGYDNPQLAHHAKNAEMLSDAFYKAHVQTSMFQRFGLKYRVIPKVYGPD